MGAISLSTPLRMSFDEHDRADSSGSILTDLLEREFIEPKMNGMTRAQLMDRIMTHNASATPEFLASFDVESLWSYLDHLMDVQRPRGAASARVRPTRRSGISMSIRRF